MSLDSSETLSWYSRLDFSMSAAARSLNRQRQTSISNTSGCANYLIAAAFLTPDKPATESQVGFSLDSQPSPKNIMDDTRQALGIPDDEKDDNVVSLLKRAVITLRDLDRAALNNEQVDGDFIFTDAVVKSMRDYARSIRTQELEPAQV